MLRRDSDINLSALNKIHIGGFGYQRDDLPNAQPLGHKRGHNVNLVVIGQGAKGVALLDVFFQQQFSIGGIALYDYGVVQPVCQNFGPLLVEFD